MITGTALAGKQSNVVTCIIFAKRQTMVKCSDNNQNCRMASALWSCAAFSSSVYMTPTTNSCSTLSRVTSSTYWMAVTKACQLQNTETQICYVELLVNNHWCYCITFYDDTAQCPESLDINTCFWIFCHISHLHSTLDNCN